MRRCKEILIYFLASVRFLAISKVVIRTCLAVIKGFENFSFNMNLNGEYRVIQRLLPLTKGVILDVGANRGEWALSAARIKPNHPIFCFEIVPETAKILEENTKSSPHIKVCKFGLSDQDQMVKVHFAKGHDAHSSIVEPLAPGEYEVIEAKVIRGDDFVKSHGIQHIGFLKIDVEGAEHHVLNGFSQLLAMSAIDVIQFEYGKFNLRSRFFLEDFFQLLDKYGYRVGKIFPHRVDFREFSPEMEDFIGPNYLAVKKDLENLILATQ